MRKSTWYATMGDYGWIMDRNTVYRAFIQSIPVGEKMEIVIQNPQVDKTLPQLKKWFAGPVKALMEVGYSKQEADGMLCKRFLTRNEGQKNEYVASKADLTKDELRETIDEAILWLTSNGLFIGETSC